MMPMRPRQKVFAVLLAVLTLSTLFNLSSAASSPNPITIINCQNLFSGGITGQSKTAGALVPSYAGSLVGVAVIIIFVVFMILGIVYAIGSAFQIEKLTTFVKSEILESVMNLIFIAALAGMLIGTPPAVNFVSESISFLSGLTVAGSPSTMSQLNINPQTSIQSLYVSSCNNLVQNVVVISIENWLGVFVGLFINNVVTSFATALAPNGFGFGVSPFLGYQIQIEIFWFEQTSFIGGMELGMFLIVTLFVVYALFPLFLYLGLLLRSFPWTRPAGGAFLALFISFYIVFPSIMYPFTAGSNLHSTYICGPNSATAGTYLCNTQPFLGAETFATIVAPIATPIGWTLYTNVSDFVSGMAFIGLNLIGFVFALLISYELIEQLAQILGAPSMQARRIFSRVA